ncbi:MULTISPECIES: aconitate hydratase [Proteiniphilum]|jgi:aconitate hydratase|uniref:aconitate hydratase n=1 Tax=Proteiniphilum TaxID=294702 RepID=UPI001EEC717B|nr:MULTISPECIES: aconitate hydratase [Proteiniphilum]ULB33030.1 aconitate hydratase [Proteiniphilum propionicum]
MIFDIDMIREVYEDLPAKIKQVKEILQRPLTYTEKILFSHLSPGVQVKNYKRATDYVDFAPDRVAMQDATAQMALLQLMNSGRTSVAVPSTVHCDHLIQAYQNATTDLETAKVTNKEVYEFLKDVSNKYGIGFWKPGAGIIHQVVFENYAFPGGMMIGTDSHTPNAGGLGMIAIGVGGADAVDVMAGLPWELKMPKLIGVKLTGKLSGWSAPKDVILKLAGILTVKGGTNAVIEYFGEGAETLPATGKGTICNMGAEVGATTSIFPFDEKSAIYLESTGRKDLADAARGLMEYLQPDPEVVANPEKYYDQLIKIDLSELEPHINGPFTPDAAYTISEFGDAVRTNNYPRRMEVGLIGSCTNSSYEDLTRAASIVNQAREDGVPVKARFLINPGSEQIRYTAERDGILKIFEDAGATVIANACGPCIGQWKRDDVADNRVNSIVTSFNRNFARRNDGNPNTHAFVASPELVAALTIAGDLCFNPLTDTLTNEKGEQVKLSEPVGIELPPRGYEVKDTGYVAPLGEGKSVVITIDPDSKRLQKLEPFSVWDGEDYTELSLLIKVKGKCTTDHISMAGPWLRFRGHLDNISDNMLIGAVNAFNDRTNAVLNPETLEYTPVPKLARMFKSKSLGSIVVAEENYGEGSSREHAAMEPRHLNVKVILVKSFARIHETNLKKQGMLALTFVNKDDYIKVQERDKISVKGLKEFAPGKNMMIELLHADGTKDNFEASHTYNKQQIEWFKAGSALNAMRRNNNLEI